VVFGVPREEIVPTARVAQAIFNYVWLTPLVPVVLLALKTRTARTAARIVRVCAWDAVLRLKGVPRGERLRLIAEAAERDLKSS
jgi:hypothetical protein